MDASEVALVTVTAVIAVSFLVLVYAPLVQIARRPLPQTVKIAWALVILATPPFGSMVWLLLDPGVSRLRITIEVD
jgi:hypothetical protein